MSDWTTRGLFLMADSFFRGSATTVNFYLALCDSSITPTPEINTLGELAEIPAGNGYTAGGVQLNRDAVDFKSLVEDDASDQVELKIKNIVFTASGGPLPASGTGARWAVLTDDNATVANRQVLAYFNLATDRNAPDTKVFTLPNLQLDLKKPA